MVEVMERSALSAFALAGHDRGGAGRLSPGARSSRPHRQARRARHRDDLGHVASHERQALRARAWHWTFLALPCAVSGNPDRPRSEILLRFARRRRARRRKSVSIFDPRALAHYHAAYQDPLHIHAMCEDYRAGRTTDLAHDEADRAAGHKIGCPMLALWGSGRTSGQCRPRSAARAGATGPPICAAMRSKAGITCRKRTRQQRRRPCWNSSVPDHG